MPLWWSSTNIKHSHLNVCIVNNRWIVRLPVSQSTRSPPLQRLSPSEVSSLSFIYSFVAGWICQFEQAKLGDWQQVGSKRRVQRVEWRGAREKDKKRLWQSSIWPRLLSESSLACQISVLTVNSHICAEHRRVSCTMVSWFRIRLDKAIGWMTHRQTHFHFLLLTPCLSLSAAVLAWEWDVWTCFNQAVLFMWKAALCLQRGNSSSSQIKSSTLWLLNNENPHSCPPPILSTTL